MCCCYLANKTLQAAGISEDDAQGVLSQNKQLGNCEILRTVFGPSGHYHPIYQINLIT